MNTKSIVVTVIAALCTAFVIVGTYFAVDRAYSQGYERGHDDGYQFARSVFHPEDGIGWDDTLDFHAPGPVYHGLLGDTNEFYYPSYDSGWIRYYSSAINDSAYQIHIHPGTGVKVVPDGHRSGRPKLRTVPDSSQLESYRPSMYPVHFPDGSVSDVWWMDNGRLVYVGNTGPDSVSYTGKNRAYQTESQGSYSTDWNREWRLQTQTAPWPLKWFCVDTSFSPSTQSRDTMQLNLLRKHSHSGQQ